MDNSVASIGPVQLEGILAFLSSPSAVRRRGAATVIATGYPEPGGLTGKGRLDRRELGSCRSRWVDALGARGCVDVPEAWGYVCVLGVRVLGGG